jgi:hypothetical protein
MKRVQSDGGATVIENNQTGQARGFVKPTSKERQRSKLATLNFVSE